MISNRFSSYATILKTFRYGNVLKPSRDWFILLGGAVVLIAVSVLWNVWTFTRIASGEILGGAEIETTAVDTSTFDRVKEQFAKRSVEAGRYTFEHHFIDPSRE